VKSLKSRAILALVALLMFAAGTWAQANCCVLNAGPLQHKPLPTNVTGTGNQQPGIYNATDEEIWLGVLSSRVPFGFLACGLCLDFSRFSRRFSFSTLIALLPTSLLPYVFASLHP